MKNKLFALFMLALLSTLTPQLSTVFAATRTWDGGGTNNNWTTATNWVGDIAPVAGDDLAFPSGALQPTSNNNFPAGTTFNSIIISGTSYNLGGNSVALNAGVAATNISGANTFNLSATLNSNQTFLVSAAAATLNLSSGKTFDTSGKTLTFAGGGVFQCQTLITNTGGVIKTGSGSASLYGNNTYSGETIVAEGFLSIYHSNALGNVTGGTTISNGAQLTLSSGVAVLREPVTLFGTLSSGGGINACAGPITLAHSNATLRVELSAPLTVNALIAGPYGFTKTRTGTLILNSNNTYTGTTTVTEGKVLVNGSQPASAILLSSFGALGGVGTVGTITTSGGLAKALAPGSSPGILTASNVTLSASTTFQVELNSTNVGAGYDQLNVGGSVTLSNTVLSVTNTLSLGGEESFVIINNDGSDAVTGTFNGLPEGAFFTVGTNQFQITYVGGINTNDVVLRKTVPLSTGVSRTWDGGGANDNWTTAANWVGDVAPGAGDDLVFPAGAARLANTNNFPAGTVFNSITIDGPNYNLRGSNIVLNAGINATNTTGQNNWFIPLSLNSNQTFSAGNAGGTQLYLYGAINLDDKELTLAGAGSAQVQSAVSGAGGLVKTGNGLAVLYTSNSFMGTLQLLQGNLTVLNNHALGATNGNTSVAAGTRLILSGSRTIAEPLVLSGRLESGAGPGIWNGPISLPVPSATIHVDTSGQLTINGAISGAGGYTKSGPNTLTLNGTNSYTGNATNSAGVLNVNGFQPQSPVILSGGALGGTGTVGIVTAIGGSLKTLAPGSSPGIFSSSNVTLNISTLFNVELNGTTPGSGYDQLNVNGSVTLGEANLSVTAGVPLAGGDSFIIVSNDGSDAVVGTFNSLPEAALVAAGTNHWRITYAGGTGNDVVLTYTNVPPLPACLMLWTNQYTAPGGLTEDYGRTIAVDDNGNVYVTGSSWNGTNFDYATLAYTGAGVPLWTNRYDGGSGDDFVYDMAAGGGAVFVTGSTVTSAGDTDYATVAYSSAGLPLWTNRYNGPGNSNDVALAVAVDNAGHVLVTGNSYSGNTGLTSDFATLAYSSAGVPLWTNRYNGPDNGYDVAKDVAVNGTGAVFVTGLSGVSGGSADFAIVAYSSAGVPLWTNRYNGPGNGFDEPNALTVDQNGNVLVTGYSLGGASSFDYATIAYSSVGVPLWTNRYNGPGNDDDEPRAVAVDNSGNVFVTGLSTGSGSGYDYATVAYSTAGTPLWTNRYNGPGNSDDWALGVAVDSGGNVFVTGFSGGVVTGDDYATLAYSSSGALLRINRDGTSSGEVAVAVAVDSSGFVFVTGYVFGNTSGPDFATIKYPPLATPFLAIRGANSQVVLRWTNPCFELQSAPAITGTFTNIPGATSPYTNSSTDAQQYFRLKKN